MKENKREQVFILLFEALFHAGDIGYVTENIPADVDISATAAAKAVAIGEKTAEIDGQIADKLKSWDIKRISKVALALLRLAVYEMLFEDSTPLGASVNEAVELCKKYSTEEEASFINGILRAVSSALEPEEN